MSNYKMEVNYLKKDELKYELQLRGVSAENQVVKGMRSQLRSLLSFEASESGLHYPQYSLKAGEELAIIRGKVTEVTALRNYFRNARCKSTETIAYSFNTFNQAHGLYSFRRIFRSRNRGEGEAVC